MNTTQNNGFITTLKCAEKFNQRHLQAITMLMDILSLLQSHNYPLACSHKVQVIHPHNMTHMALLTSSDLGGMSVRASWAASSTQHVIQQSSSPSTCSTYSFSVDILWLLLSWMLQPEHAVSWKTCDIYTISCTTIYSIHYLCILQYSNGVVWENNETLTVVLPTLCMSTPSVVIPTLSSTRRYHN